MKCTILTECCETSWCPYVCFWDRVANQTIWCWFSSTLRCSLSCLSLHFRPYHTTCLCFTTVWGGHCSQSTCLKVTVSLVLQQCPPNSNIDINLIVITACSVVLKVRFWFLWHFQLSIIVYFLVVKITFLYIWLYNACSIGKTISRLAQNKPFWAKKLYLT